MGAKQAFFLSAAKKTEAIFTKKKLRPQEDLTHFMKQNWLSKRAFQSRQWVKTEF